MDAFHLLIIVGRNVHKWIELELLELEQRILSMPVFKIDELPLHARIEEVTWLFSLLLVVLLHDLRALNAFAETNSLQRISLVLLHHGGVAPGEGALLVIVSAMLDRLKAEEVLARLLRVQYTIASRVN